MQRRALIKAEQIARMVVKGMKGTQIALELGMSYDGVTRILRNPDYLRIEEQVRSGVIGKMDARLDRRAEMGEEVEEAVPEALAVLLDAVKKKRDLKAALELLDRDPQRQFAKSKPANAGATPFDQKQHSSLPSDALDQAIKDADLTHNILKSNPQQPTKPAEA
jgi:hypothetical protein